MNPNPSLIIFQIVVYTLSLLPLFLSIKVKGGRVFLVKTQNYKNCIILLGIVFCIFASYDGDWYHYINIIEAIYTRVNPYTHLEWIHVIIIKYLSFGIYLFWRTLIWGTTFLFVYLSFKRLKEDNLITWSCFICVSILQISTGRVYLGIAMLFYGFCCMIKPSKHWRSVIKGLVFMSLSMLFHKSMIIYIAAGFFALIYYKKWMLFTAVCCIPVLIKLFTYLLGIYIGSDDASNAAIRYIDAEQTGHGFTLKIYQWSLYLLIFSIFIVSSQYFIKYLHFPRNPFRRIWQMAFGLIAMYIIVFCALTLKGIGSLAISARIINGLFFLIPLLLSIMIRDRYKVKSNLILFTLFYLIGLYRLSYAFYLQSIGGF